MACPETEVDAKERMARGRRSFMRRTLPFLDVSRYACTIRIVPIAIRDAADWKKRGM
jgi:hypothetical protein